MIGLFIAPAVVLDFLLLLVRNSIYAEHAICYHRPICLTVCHPTHSQSQTVEVRIMQLSPQSSPVPLVFAV